MLYKFQEAVFFSSWGFFLLASPIMIAYGIVVGAPWYYYLLLVPLIISFVYIPVRYRGDLLSARSFTSCRSCGESS